MPQQHCLDASTVVVVTPRDIGSNQVAAAAIVTPERFDLLDHPQQSSRSYDSIGVVEGTTTALNNDSFEQLVNYNNLLSEETEHHGLSQMLEIEHCEKSIMDHDYASTACSSSVPTLLQESQSLKLSHLYTTIPNLSCNPWMIGCSI